MYWYNNEEKAKKAFIHYTDKGPYFTTDEGMIYEMKDFEQIEN